MSEANATRHARIEADLENWTEDADQEPIVILAKADVVWLLEERNRLLIEPLREGRSFKCPECRAYLHIPPLLLLDDDTAVERTLTALRRTGMLEADQEDAEAFVAALREGGQR